MIILYGKIHTKLKTNRQKCRIKNTPTFPLGWECSGTYLLSAGRCAGGRHLLVAGADPSVRLQLALDVRQTDALSNMLAHVLTWG